MAEISKSLESRVSEFAARTGQEIKEALQKPLFPSLIEQNRSVRFFFTTSKNGVFLPSK